MDGKVTLLLFLIGSIVVLSHLDDDMLGRMRHQLAGGRWRAMIPLRKFWAISRLQG
jgi:hypothetical protein